MTTISKVYLHNAASGATGTLPASNASISTTPPGSGVTVSLTNKAMDDTIGVAQASIAKTTLANTANQQVPIGRWILDTPLAAQTITEASVTAAGAGNVSSTNSQFFGTWVVGVWRPSTGALVGLISDVISGTTTFNWNATAETAASGGVQHAGVTCQDGDLLVVELWRNDATQAMATAYTNTIFYDGTTEGSTTSQAAFVSFPTPITLSSGATPSLVTPPRASAGLTLRQRRPRG